MIADILSTASVVSAVVFALSLALAVGVLAWSPKPRETRFLIALAVLAIGCVPTAVLWIVLSSLPAGN